MSTIPLRARLLAGAAVLGALSLAASAQAVTPTRAVEAFRSADAAYKAYSDRRFDEAVRDARRAVALRPDVPRWRLLLVRALEAAGDRAGALAAAERAVHEDRAGPELRRGLAVLRASARPVKATLASPPPAAPALPAGYDAARRAFAALSQGRAADAVAPAREAVRQAPRSMDDRRLLIDALTQAGRAEEAAVAAEDALAQAGPDGGVQARLGYLRLAAGKPAPAADAFAQALALSGPGVDRAAVGLSLSDARAAAGDAAGALAALPFPAADEAYDIASRRSTLLIRLDRKPEALVATQRALVLAPADARPGLQAAELQLLVATGHLAEARTRLAQAAREPGYAGGREADLAELAVGLGDDRSAQVLFARARAAKALHNPALLDAAYVSKRRYDNAIAADLFEDALRENLNGPQAIEPLRRIRLGREAAELRRTWGVNASILSGAANLPASALGIPAGASDARTTQGGAELYWRPPVIGYRNGRTVELFVRGFATLDDDAGGATGGESVQGYVGARWKPFGAQNLVLEASRLVKIGDAARNDWLVRAAWSDERGLDPAIGKSSRWAYQTYAEVDRLFDPGQTLAFTYLRVGRAFQVGPRLVVTPLIDASWAFDDLASSQSAFGIGPGVGFRYELRGKSLTAPNRYVELNVGRRFKVAGGDRADGVFASLSLLY